MNDEIASVRTGLEVTDELLKDKDFDTFIALPIITSLLHECRGFISEGGIYEFNLIVKKLK